MFDQVFIWTIGHNNKKGPSLKISYISKPLDDKQPHAACCVLLFRKILDHTSMTCLSYTQWMITELHSVIFLWLKVLFRMYPTGWLITVRVGLKARRFKGQDLTLIMIGAELPSIWDISHGRFMWITFRKKLYNYSQTLKLLSCCIKLILNFPLLIL